MLPTTALPPTTLGTCATLACLWEATAAKPGNVYRGADFDDLTYVDFLTSAAVIGPVIDQARELGVGSTMLAAVRLTQATVATNTNLGILLLIAPLAAVPVEQPLQAGIQRVLDGLDESDTLQVYEAIRTANPGGLGTAEQADVHDESPPEITLLEAMHLAADRDLIARQYVNGFQQVFEVANRIEQAAQQGNPLNDAIVYSFLQLLAEIPDSLIQRKCGFEVARQVSTAAGAVLVAGLPGDANYERAVADFDFSLRSDGHRRNPGTSADMVAAALFVLLRENRFHWPVQFYRR